MCTGWKRYTQGVYGVGEVYPGGYENRGVYPGWYENRGVYPGCGRGGRYTQGVVGRRGIPRV